MSAVKHFDSLNQLIWLCRLRWVAVIGQLTIIFVTAKYFTESIPVQELLISILIIIISNLAVYILKPYRSIHQREIIGSILLLDTLILTYQLAICGGPQNPFSIVYIIHVSIAALLLGKTWTWGMVSLCIICFGLLFLFHREIPELSHAHHTSEAFSFHLYGMYLAFSLVSILTGFFLSKMAEIIKKKEQEISVAVANQEKLSALTTLSAGAAHELGSPLGTIGIAASELKGSLLKGKITPDMVSDAELISTELDRCRNILNKMSCKAGEFVGEYKEELSGEEIMKLLKQELSKEHQNVVNFVINSKTAIYTTKQALLQSLIILIKNGLDALHESGSVTVEISETKSSFIFRVSDTGTGIEDDIIKKIGEPFFTTKDPGEGMGLGLFLVKVFAERIGGSLNFDSKIGIGTNFYLEIPRTI